MFSISKGSLNKMNILTIIPARKGSKGVPKKNKRILGEIPLVEWTIEFASKLPDNFIKVVSSDDQEILNLGKKYNLLNFGLRPSNLAEDKSLTIDVIKHELECAQDLKIDFQGVLLLQPTCPFRSIEVFSDAFKEFYKNTECSFVGVKDVEGNHPFRMKEIKDGKLVNFIDQGFEDMRPRQDLPKVYLRNGSLYLTSLDNIYRGKILGDLQKPIIMGELLSVNIDTEVDFFIAEKYKDDFLAMKDY